MRDDCRNAKDFLSSSSVVCVILFILIFCPLFNCDLFVPFRQSLTWCVYRNHNNVPSCVRNPSFYISPSKQNLASHAFTGCWLFKLKFGFAYDKRDKWMRFWFRYQSMCEIDKNDLEHTFVVWLEDDCSFRYSF